MELIARRQFVPAYIALDTVFLLALAGLLLWKKRRMAALVGGIMGVVYFIVDYGVFHLICHSRSIEGGSLFWTLLWMSMSYGFTNFAWIWLALDKDEYLIEWSLLILCWWFCCPMLAQLIGFGQMPIVIQRTTGAYHGWMAAIRWPSCGIWGRATGSAASTCCGCWPLALRRSLPGRQRCCSAAFAAPGWILRKNTAR